MFSNKYLFATIICALSGLPALAQNTHAGGITIYDSNTSNADLYVEGPSVLDDSACIGNSCALTETFDLDTLLKLNGPVTGIEFRDSSQVSIYPATDWRLFVNDRDTLANGGLNRFSIEDLSAGTTPWTIEANAPDNAFWMTRFGTIGMGTTVPNAYLHIVGNLYTPSVRMDTTGAGAQSWEIIGDSTFSIRDNTNTLTPFQINSAAPTNSFVIDASGEVGIGTNKPTELLHIRSNAINTDAFALFDANGAGSDSAFQLRQNGIVPSTWEFRNQQDSGRLNVGLAGGNTPFKIDNAANNNLMRLGRNGKPGEVNITGTLVVNNTQLNVPDYVFADEYALRPLTEVKAFIDENSHLPDVPSEADIKANGLDMTAMQMTLLKKVEELTLYTLEQEAIIASYERRFARLESMMAAQVGDRPLD
ncbi:hypothetical protein A8B82_12055 [Sulfitobacter sp. EhC04]|uniref:hypothetical protein n=1 Tax=Sulfitobacter sp. EhC04 TaxID=1849168 RepID=UPI0007F394C6|nr:hypothetical protein [Sulfitobacter sp. EhC04]OAN77642.1 hypothetical protein A8B82_12055 [Sulfitobacter sp. EhC04]